MRGVDKLRHTVAAGVSGAGHMPLAVTIDTGNAALSLRLFWVRREPGFAQNRPRFCRGFGATDAKFPSDHNVGVRTCQSRRAMSGFGGKAENIGSLSISGFDHPKRTSASISCCSREAGSRAVAR